jgi:hypothetical protein
MTRKTKKAKRGKARAGRNGGLRASIEDELLLLADGGWRGVALGPSAQLMMEGKKRRER